MYQDKNIVRDKKGVAIEIHIVWCIEDVLETAKQKDIKLTRKQAGEVLEACYHKHDCNNGITWDVIEYWIDEVVAGN
jgi:hypothetical protein